MALKSGRVGIHPSQVDPITGMLIGGSGGASIDDTTIASDKTWSSQKINTELNNKQDTLTAGSNITIENDVISSTASGGLLPELQITATTGSTVTATKGATVITATEISSGLFTCEVPEFGTYTVSDGTDSTTVTVDTVKIYEVEIIPTPSVISVTLTLYSATEDQVTVVDEDGTHLEQFASGQSSKSITVKVLPSGSNVTFTSSIAKNPSDLSDYYSKTVNITSATTEVYVMPDKTLYWYGYESADLEDCTTANGWSTNVSAHSVSSTNITRNTNNISFNPPNNYFTCVGNKTALPTNSTVKAICDGTPRDGYLFALYDCNSKVIGSLETAHTGVTGLQTLSGTLTNTYVAAGMADSRQPIMYALWYE